MWIISDTITSAALADLFGVSVHARRFLGALPLARLMSQLGQTRTSRRTNVMSALPFNNGHSRNERGEPASFRSLPEHIHGL